LQNSLKKAIILSVMELKNKKVLVMGLGLLGGGIATTKWLVKHGAKATVTDLKTKKELAGSIKELRKATKKINLVLGKHRESDFKNNEIIVVNPAVPRESKYLKIAKESGAQIENEASLFFRFCKNPIIAVSGTRGKTTTVNWIHHFLKTKYPKAVLTGNSSDNPMLKALDELDGKSPVVVELSSWHLEILPNAKKAPRIAVITNIFPDHLNRYRNLKDYALAKANIFRDQAKSDFLILNRNNDWTKFFLRKFAGWRTQSKILYFPFKTGINEKEFKRKFGRHNLENLMAAFLAAKTTGVPEKAIRRVVKTLPQIKFRQEFIFKAKNLKIINDSAATSPEATIVALERFSKENAEIILIAGGTDKNLEYRGWVRAVKKYVRPQNLYLLNGSATKKMIGELLKEKRFKNKLQVFESLPEILKAIKLKTKIPKQGIILFSPGAASFEKFKNEFDRGEKFNRLSRLLL